MLGLLPIIPPLALLSLWNLKDLKQLPKPWLTLLGVFLGTQLLAATLTPDPRLSVPLALARAALTVALLLTGYTLGTTRALRPALIGYALVALTAFATTLLLHPTEALNTRLIHPYYTSVSLGLAGTLGLLLAVTWQGGPLWWRTLGGLTSLSMFLWSGSRGPLIALIAGLIAALAVSLKSQWRPALIALTGAAALIFALQTNAPGGLTTNVTGRFMENTLTGRGAYWADALNTTRTHPWGGVGPYQLGPHLTTQYSPTSCQLWLKKDRYGLNTCPPTLNQLRGMWLIAHNTAFHLLGETGIVGLSGWLALMGALALTTWRSRDPLLNALTWATAAIGLVDNPTLLPNLGHAELYWLAGGLAIAQTQHSKHPTTHTLNLAPAAPLIGCVLLVYFTLPLWLDRIKPPPTPNLPTFQAITMPTQLNAGEATSLFMQASIPAGQYPYTLQACPTSQPCQTLTSGTLNGPQTTWTQLWFTAPPAGTYQLTLRLSNPNPHLSIERPLAERSWAIESK